MKLKLILIGVGAVLAALGVFFNPFVVVKKSEIKTFETNAFNDSVSIAKLNLEIIVKDSIYFSIKQDLDICNDNKSNHKTVIAQLTKERNEARAEAKINLEAIEHYEQNGLIRYFEKPFLSRCYIEVFEKPDCIKNK